MTTFDPAQHPRGTGGQFAAKANPDPGQLDLGQPPVRFGTAKAGQVEPGDVLLREGRPVQVATVARDRWMVSLTFDQQAQMPVGCRGEVRIAPDKEVYRVSEPIGSFDGADRIGREDLDDEGFGEAFSVGNTQVRYNDQRLAEVTVNVEGPGAYNWHLERYLAYDPETLAGDRLPDGRTKAEAFDQWRADVAIPAMDAGIVDRYGVDIDMACEDDPNPYFTGVTLTAEPDVEELFAAPRRAYLRYVNEMDPGTYGHEYPVTGWLDEAVAKHGHPFGSARAIQSLPELT